MVVAYLLFLWYGSSRGGVAFLLWGFSVVSSIVAVILSPKTALTESYQVKLCLFFAITFVSEYFVVRTAGR